MRLECVEDVKLLVRPQRQKLLNQFARVGAPDKAGDVHVDKGGHQVLAVKAIHDASMTRNGVGKIFDFKGPLESTCEEPSKWANERGEGGERNAVDLERVHPHGFPANERLDHPGNVVLLQAEQVRWLTVHSETVGVIVVFHRTDEASVPRHHVGEQKAKHHSSKEAPNEAFPGLLWRELHTENNTVSKGYFCSSGLVLNYL